MRVEKSLHTDPHSGQLFAGYLLKDEGYALSPSVFKECNLFHRDPKSTRTFLLKASIAS